MKPVLDLNVVASDQVAAVLRKAAREFEISATQLQADWQDPHAGNVWLALAKVLSEAADQCDKIVW